LPAKFKHKEWPEENIEIAEHKKRASQGKCTYKHGSMKTIFEIHLIYLEIYLIQNKINYKIYS